MPTAAMIGIDIRSAGRGFEAHSPAALTAPVASKIVKSADLFLRHVPISLPICASIEVHMNHTTQGLERFVEAQDAVYHTVVAELSMGHKETHWMWFIFPQLKELGKSAMAKRFGIESADEARAYFAHPVLSRRLVECTQLLLAQRNANAYEIFGSPDELKLRSCMSLFCLTAPQEPVFRKVLAVFFRDKLDEVTVKILGLPTPR